MSLNKDIFFSKVNNLSCFEKRPHVAVGVSGGPDSMALVYLVKKWIKEKNGAISVLIFDHKIRNNSKDEANEVKRNLKDLKINAHIIEAKKNRLKKKNMVEARNNRFDGMVSFCKNNNILHLFLGHHFDDNLETFLIRKINGSNLEGLASMKSITYIDKIQVIRPLITISKNNINNFNKKNKIIFLNDPSNMNLYFTRVKVRNFLKNESYKYLVKNDFNTLSKQIPSYKKMIWELFIRNLIKVKSNRIQIRFDELIKKDELIIEKHILLILKFFSNKKYQTKTSKIYNFIDAMKKPEFKIFNLSGVIIQKNRGFLTFSEK